MPMIENWKLVVLERYAKFDGRAGRAEFWWYVLANIVLNVAISILVSIGFAIATAIGVLVVVLASGLYLALIVPSIAVAIRRLHDTDKSGWLLLVGLIPFVGFIILLVFYIQEGTAGPNQYGAGPEPAAG
jgi:uncharacterized membrane protein YhaH (DUF805 family)